MTDTNKKAPAPARIQDAFETYTNEADFPIDQSPRKEVIEVLKCLNNRGHLVFNGSRGDFYVCKYGYAQHCHGAHELLTFAERLGVSQ